MITTLIAFGGQVLSTWLGRTLAATAAALLALQVYASWHQRIGADRLARTLNQQTEVLDAKARKARDATDRPGAADRLRQHYCRDC